MIRGESSGFRHKDFTCLFWRKTEGSFGGNDFEAVGSERRDHSPATMNTEQKKGTIMGGKPTWLVAAVYEEAETRKGAMEFCDALARRFWSECDFDISWWSLALLEEKTFDAEITAKAAEANLIIFALRPAGELSAELRAWIEAWLGRRGDREGVLVGLNDPVSGSGGATAEKFVFLRNAAHRYGLDYLTEIPQTLARCIPDSLESYAKRADAVTSVLDEILRKKIPRPLLLP
jgi:hypothetical protein